MAPDAVAARDEIARTLLDLTGARAARRLGVGRELLGRAAELAAALDRVGEVRLGAGDGAAPERKGRGRRGASKRSGGGCRTDRSGRVRGHSRRGTGRGRRRRRRDGRGSRGPRAGHRAPPRGHDPRRDLARRGTRPAPRRARRGAAPPRPGPARRPARDGDRTGRGPRLHRPARPDRRAARGERQPGARRSTRCCSRGPAARPPPEPPAALAEESATVRLEATVRGVVQGVGFRWFVMREAQRRALTGWVANEHDGTVRVVAEGPPEAIAALRSALRGGTGRSSRRAGLGGRDAGDRSLRRVRGAVRGAFRRLTATRPTDSAVAARTAPGRIPRSPGPEPDHRARSAERGGYSRPLGGAAS